jgi:hypothetical protein
VVVVGWCRSYRRQTRCVMVPKDVCKITGTKEWPPAQKDGAVNGEERGGH